MAENEVKEEELVENETPEVIDFFNHGHSILKFNVSFAFPSSMKMVNWVTYSLDQQHRAESDYSVKNCDV